MLNIHYGRESKNKERYMFDKIKREEGRILLLVPDQFTLQAEKEAFFYLDTDGIMDLEVLSFSRLGKRVIAETGGSARTPIDERGRFMLITKLAGESREKLKLFKNSSRAVSFARMANDLIYEMKQYNQNPAGLAALIESMDGDTILKRKLSDIWLIYREYEEYTKKKYLDGEDYIELYTKKIGESELARESSVWVYGFDYFTPKNMELLKELMRHSRELNVLLTYDSETDTGIFDLTGGVAERLARIARENGVAFSLAAIPDSYKKTAYEKEEPLAAVERELFSIPAKPCENSSGVTLIKAANMYSEIESAAAYTLSLVRDHSLRYKDIAVICNDTEERAQIARRVFSGYGINLFIDQKRSFGESAAARFIVLLLNVVINGYRSADVLGMMKTGMTDMPVFSIEELENYSVKYKIKGNRWKKEFQKGREEYGEAFSEIEDTRRELFDFISRFEKSFAKANTVREKTEALYFYLVETVNLPEKLEKAAAVEAEKGFLELAGQTAQIWKEIVNIFDQMVEIIGDEKICHKDFYDILKSGFDSAEVGVLPPASDGLIFGTMQRMRLGRIKALIIIGANEGIMPAAMAEEGLLSDDEKNRLFEKNIEICRREELRIQEEQLAIYKNMSKPEKFLWMSCSVSDNDGGKLNPSVIFEKVREIFPALLVEKDIISQNETANLIQTKESTLTHMTDALRESLIYEKPLSGEWAGALDWYREKKDRRFELITDGLFFKNKSITLDGKIIEGLYKKGRDEMVLSPSRLEKYGKCPFSFFMDYGLSPDEMRVFEAAGREIGEIYHNCVMKFSKHLTDSAKWADITKEESDALVDMLIDEEAGTYREGLLSSGNEEAYRAGRLKAVCRENAWVLVGHVRRGSIRDMKFEERFGRGGSISPVTVPLSSGKKVLIEGKIDRIDELTDGSVKIIDYKSGREKFSIAEAKAGMRLQLMLYLKAAQKGKAEPAGIFYYTIDENVETGRMDGIAVNKASVIDSIDGEFQQYSDIIPVKKLKDGTVKGNSESNLLSEAEFKELQGAVDEKVKELCEKLVSGRADIRPKKSGGLTACTYCGYNSVCGFDVSFDGFRYENV